MDLIRLQKRLASQHKTDYPSFNKWFGSVKWETNALGKRGRGNIFTQIDTILSVKERV